MDWYKQAQSNPLDGKSNQVARKTIFNLVNPLTKGFFSDQSWQAVQNIWKTLNANNIDWHIRNSEYQHNAQGIANSKRWHLEFNFTNDKARPTTIYGTIIASGAGSVQDPLETYDLVFTL
jgi:hypothetical protein